MLRTWGSLAVAIVVALAAFIFVGAYWGFYPVGVIVLLAIGLVAALVVRRQEKPESRTSSEDQLAQRRHDARLVAELRTLIPRTSIEWVRAWDFGNSWRGEQIRPYFTFVWDFDNVEHQPLDPELAAAFDKLLRAAKDLTSTHAHDSFPERGKVDDWRSTGIEDAPGGKYGELKELHLDRQRKLNDAADPVGEAYDEVMEVAKRKFVIDADDVA